MGGGSSWGSVTRDASGAVVSSYSSDFSSDDFMSGGDWGGYDYSGGGEAVEGGDYGIGGWL